MSEAYSTLNEISRRFDKEDLLLLQSILICVLPSTVIIFLHIISFNRVKRQKPR